MEERFIVDQVI